MEFFDWTWEAFKKNTELTYWFNMNRKSAQIFMGNIDTVVKEIKMFTSKNL